MNEGEHQPEGFNTGKQHNDTHEFCGVETSSMAIIYKTDKSHGSIKIKNNEVDGVTRQRKYERPHVLECWS